MIGSLFIWLFGCPFFTGATSAAYAQANGDNRLHVQADKLVSQSKSNYIHFEGNVVVTLETTRIESDELRVFYNQLSGGEGSVNRDNIEKIVASGHVQIDTENRSATCDQAVYRTETEILVLTGDLVEIKSENNFVTGKKITFNQKTGEIIIDGNTSQRVNAIIYQGRKNAGQSQPERDTP